jgi:hypothetical protein
VHTRRLAALMPARNSEDGSIEWLERRQLGELHTHVEFLGQSAEVEEEIEEGLFAKRVVELDVL